jgi:hypothetical protein
MLQTAKKPAQCSLPRLDASDNRFGQSARLKYGILQEAQEQQISLRCAELSELAS